MKKTISVLLALIMLFMAVSPALADGGAWICPTCGRKMRRNFCRKDGTPRPTEKPVHEHVWKAATCTEPKKCTVCGATEGKALGHDWEEADCTHPKTCTVCGATEGTALGHDWQPATVDAPETCSRCKETRGTPKPASVVCPSCGYENPAGANWCEECGESFSGKIVCPSCGHENPAGANWCEECGESFSIVK